MSESLHNKTH